MCREKAAGEMRYGRIYSQFMNLTHMTYGLKGICRQWSKSIYCLLFIFLGLAISFDTACCAQTSTQLNTLGTENTEVVQPDPLFYLNLLRNRQYDVIDGKLNTLQQEYEKDTEREQAAANAFNWLVMADPELESFFREWQRIYPESYAARVALGNYYLAMAGAWRGGNYINETHPFRIEKMDSYLNEAVSEYKKSLPLTEKPIISYYKLIVVSRYRGDLESRDHWLDEALKRDTYCVSPRSAYMRTLEPKWGGSYEAMRAFTETTRKIGHPKLEKAAKFYEAWIYWDMGQQKYFEKDYVAALDEYQKAIDIYKNSAFYLDRASIYQAIGQTGLAMADLAMALQLSPLSSGALYMRGISLLDKRQPEEALKDIIFAAELGDMDAAYKLGELYTTGELGIPLNMEEGIKWWQKAAYFWNAEAAFALGKTYERGLGVKEDKKIAVSYYNIAAGQGHGPAINDLGLMLWYGYGAPADQKTAVKLWIAGAKKNIWQSKHNLKFFLNPFERFLLLYYYPQLLMEDKQLIGLCLASILLAALLVIAAVRISRKNRQNGRAENKHNVSI